MRGKIFQIGFFSQGYTVPRLIANTRATTSVRSLYSIHDHPISNSRRMTITFNAINGTRNTAGIK